MKWFAEALQSRNITIKGIIFNGNPVNSSKKIICEYTGLKSLFHIDNEQTIDKQTILKFASEPNIKSLFLKFRRFFTFNCNNSRVALAVE